MAQALHWGSGGYISKAAGRIIGFHLMLQRVTNSSLEISNFSIFDRSFASEVQTSSSFILTEQKDLR
ncbi:unnamed protein product [Caretta caretta]